MRVVATRVVYNEIHGGWWPTLTLTCLVYTRPAGLGLIGPGRAGLRWPGLTGSDSS